MNKNEAAWLALRLTGLVVALSGLKQFAAFFYLLGIFLTGGMRDMKTDLSAEYAFNTTWPVSLGGAIMLAVSAYLLFGGRALHRILMTEE